MSFLAKELQKNAKLLQKGAQKHIDEILEFENQVSNSSEIIKDLLITNSDANSEEIKNWITEYFGSDRINFTAIDGTLFKTSILDASIFFAGSYECSGHIDYSRQNITPHIEYTNSYSNHGRGITSVLPLHVTEILEVDTQFDLDLLTSDSGVQVREDVILDQSNIAESVMLFSEYFLAYKSLLDIPQAEAQLLLLDRSIAGDHSSLIARTQKQILWKKTVNLLGYELQEENSRPLNENDFFWGRWFMADNFDPIRPYLKFKILKLLFKSSNGYTQNELTEILNIPRGLKNDLASELKFLERKGFICRKEKYFQLRPMYIESWILIKKLVLEIGTRLFSTEADDLETKSPFIIIKKSENGESKEKWITTRDLAFLTLFCQYMIIEWLWSHKGMVLGISKDTAARDFRRQLLPIASNQNLIDAVAPSIVSLPQSDRSFLQQFANKNPDVIPWILTEYDAVFRTISADGELVVGAKSNLSGAMKLFTKSYMQLKRSNSSNELQSHVLLLDRIIHTKDLEQNLENIVILPFRKNEKNDFNYQLQTFFPIHNQNNYPQKFILNFLLAMVPHSIPEAFGYNKPLFIADKVAKFYLNEFKRLLMSMGSLLGNNINLRKEQYAYEAFRETREEMELNRRNIEA